MSIVSPAPKRPVLRYLGGKWRIASWIIGHLPPHRVYVEPFGGAASVLMRKPRSYAEVYNDLSDDVVCVFTVLRDPASAADLCRRLELTPFSRVDFEAAYEHVDDPIERARRVIFRSFAGFGSGSATACKPEGMRTRASTWRPPTGFRPDSNKSGSTPAHDWRTYPRQIVAFTERLRGVVIESRPAHDVIASHDRKDTLHYVDPPYLHTTRGGMKNSSGHYQFEMSDVMHESLLSQLVAVEGMVVLSAYPHPMYETFLAARGWQRLTKQTHADGARDRLEVLWLNPAAQQAKQVGAA